MSFGDLKSKIIWVNGCFDVLHRGHIELFKHAYDLAGPEGLVIVGVDRDERIKKLKGDARPFNSLPDRVEVLRSIKYIDMVDCFSTDEELIGLIRDVHKPDILLVGEEYKFKEVIGAEHVNEVAFFPRIGKYSTTEILNYND